MVSDYDFTHFSKFLLHFDSSKDISNTIFMFDRFHA